MPTVVEEGAVAPETCSSHLVSPTTADAASRTERRRHKAAQQQRAKGSAQQRLLQFVQRQILLRFPPPHIKQQPPQQQHQYNTALDTLPEHRDFHRRPPPVVSAEGILARWLVAEPQRLQTLRIFPGLKFDVLQNHRERRTAGLCSSASETTSSLALGSICPPSKHGVAHLFPAVPKAEAISAATVEESGHIPSSEEPWWLWPLSSGATCGSKSSSSAPPIKEDSEAQAALLASEGRLSLHEPLTGALVEAAADLRRGAAESECAVCLQLFNSSAGGFLCNECQQGFDDTHLRVGQKGAYCGEIRREPSTEVRTASRPRTRRGRPPKAKTTLSSARPQTVGGKRPACSAEDPRGRASLLQEAAPPTESLEARGGLSPSQVICTRRKCKRRRGDPRSSRRIRAGCFMEKATSHPDAAGSLRPGEAEFCSGQEAKRSGASNGEDKLAECSPDPQARPGDSRSAEAAVSSFKCDERSAARAAAAAAESGWWVNTDAKGVPASIPPLLLPLLPSIYSFQAHAWPPPPAKRRHASCYANGEAKAAPLRRRRGLACLAVRVSSVERCRKKQRGLNCISRSASPQSSAVCALGAGAVSVSSEGEAGTASKVFVSAEPVARSLETREVLGPSIPQPAVSSSPVCRKAEGSESLEENGEAREARGEGESSSVSVAEACKALPHQAGAEGSRALEVLPTRRKSLDVDAGESASSRCKDGLSAPQEDISREGHSERGGDPDAGEEERGRERSPPPGEKQVSSNCSAAPPSELAASTPRRKEDLVKAAPSQTPLGQHAASPNPGEEPKDALMEEQQTNASGNRGEGASGPTPSARERAASSAAPLSGPGGSVLARIGQGLLVGRSSLGRESGLGLFACRPFPRRARICEYSGVLIDRGTALLLRSMRCASHVVNVQMQHSYLLGFHTPSPLLGGGAFINDGRWRRDGEGPGVCVRFKVAFDRHRAAQRVLIVATQDIQAGQELLTSYDNDYWRLLALSNPHKRMGSR